MASSLSDHCMNAPPPVSFLATGKEELWGTMDVYVAGAETTTSAAIVLISDIYGWKIPQIRQLADWLAVQGFVVVIPDFFRGDPATPEIDRKAWLAKHPAMGCVKEAQEVVDNLKSKGVQYIAATGFCWGGKVAVNLLNLTAIAILHPSFVTAEEIQAVKVPIAILGAEIDMMNPPELIAAFKEAVEANSEIAPKSLVKVFPGVKHGFSVRYDSKEEEKAAFEARQDLVAFFSEVLV